jgi:hypothetical protein
MISLDSQSHDRCLGSLRDEETEIEPLGPSVAFGSAAVPGRSGQTRVTCVESESTDDE